MLNKFKISRRFQEGFTGIDVLLALVLSSIIFLGMSYVFIDVTEKLRVEEIRSDVLKYGNTILNALEKDMVQATKVECKEFQSYSKITCFKDDVETVYSVDGGNGILKDGKPPDVFLHTDSGKGSWLRYNSVNNKGQQLYNIFNFECNKVGINFENTNDVENYIFDVKMEIDLYNTEGEKGEIIDEILFNRRIYAVNSYLKTAI